MKGRVLASGYKIRVVGRTFLTRRAKTIENDIRQSFKDSNFNRIGEHRGNLPMRRFNVEDVVSTCLKSNTSYADDRRSVVALDKSGKIIGMVFHVPIKNKGKEAGEYSWFYTSSSHPLRMRVAAGNRMIDEVHQMMRTAGFKRVVASMGTKEGAEFLKKHHGYQLIPGKTNTWVKELGPRPKKG